MLVPLRHGEHQTLSLHETASAHNLGWRAALTAVGTEVHSGCSRHSASFHHAAAAAGITARTIANLPVPRQDDTERDGRRFVWYQDSRLEARLAQASGLRMHTWIR